MSITQKTTLYAHWIPEYAITFDSNGVVLTNSIVASKTVLQGSTYGDLPSPTSNYGVFIGWFTSEDDSGIQITSSSTVSITQNTTLYAHWIPEYIVTFDINGVTLTNSIVSSKTVLQGSTYGDLPSPTRSNYQFAGWFTAADNSGTEIISSSTVSITQNTTLYAHWIPEYTVTFDTNGVTLTNSIATSKIVLQGSTYGDLPSPTSNYGVFAGWFTEADEGTEITAECVVSLSDNVTLYAHWDRYSVTYDSNNGSGETYVQYFLKGDSVLIKHSFTNPGYYLGNWYTNSNGTGTKYVGFNSYTLNESIHIYAEWIPYTYTVTLTANSSGVPATCAKSVQVTRDADWDLPTPVLSPDVGTFLGWYTAASGGTVIKNGDKVLLTDSITLYAHWNFSYQVVTFDVNAGGFAATCDTETKDFISGYKYTGLPTPTSKQAKFLGWYTAAEGGDQIISTTDVSNDGSLTLYAHWQRYMIVYHANNGTDETHIEYLTLNDNNQAVCRLIICSDYFEKIGGVFNKWNTRADGTGTNYSQGIQQVYYKNGVESGIDLYATWNILNYVVYHANNGTDATETVSVENNINHAIESHFTDAAPSGKSLLYWSTQSDGSGTIYNIGVYKKFSGDTYETLDLYAVWGEIAAAVTVNNSSLYRNAQFNYATVKDGWDAVVDLSSNASNTGITLTLYEDWIAADGSLGTGANFRNGVPVMGGRYASVDLNGHTISNGTGTVMIVQNSDQASPGLSFSNGTINGVFEIESGGFANVRTMSFTDITFNDTGSMLIDTSSAMGIYFTNVSASLLNRVSTIGSISFTGNNESYAADLVIDAPCSVTMKDQGIVGNLTVANSVNVSLSNVSVSGNLSISNVQKSVNLGNVTVSGDFSTSSVVSAGTLTVGGDTDILGGGRLTISYYGASTFHDIIIRDGGQVLCYDSPRSSSTSQAKQITVNGDVTICSRAAPADNSDYSLKWGVIYSSSTNAVNNTLPIINGTLTIGANANAYIGAAIFNSDDTCIVVDGTLKLDSGLSTINGSINYGTGYGVDVLEHGVIYLGYSFSYSTTGSFENIHTVRAQCIDLSNRASVSPATIFAENLRVGDTVLTGVNSRSSYSGLTLVSTVSLDSAVTDSTVVAVSKSVRFTYSYGGNGYLYASGNSVTGTLPTNGSSELLGLFTSKVGGTKVINADRTLVAGLFVDGKRITDSDGNALQGFDSGVYLYPQWRSSIYLRDSDNNQNLTDHGIDDGLLTYVEGVSLAISFVPNAPAGKTFLYWSADKVNEYTEIPSTQTGGVVLYAMWSYVPFTLSYVSNGGTSVDPRDFTVVSDEIPLGNITKKGNTFQGWYTDPEFSDDARVTAIASGTAHDVTVYAKWAPYTLNIEFNSTHPVSKTDSVSDVHVSIQYGVASVLPAGVFSVEHYRLAGWSLSSNSGAVLVEDGGNLTYTTDGSVTNNSTLRLYAVWEIIVYTISIDAGSHGTAIDPAPTYTYRDSTLDIDSLVTPAPGYTILRYEVVYDAGNWSAGDVFQKTGSMMTRCGNVTVRPVYDLEEIAATVNGYNATYDGNSHDISVAPSHNLPGAVFTYQWKSGSTAIDGAVSSTYAVRDKADSGTYTCVITLTDGEFTKTLSKVVSANVNAIRVDITTGSGTKAYDGTALVVGNPAVTLAKTVAGEGFTFRTTDNVVNVTGKDGVENRCYYTPNEGTLSDNYYFIITEGKLIITQRSVNVVISGATSTVEYDGLEHSVYGGTVTTDDTVFDVSTQLGDYVLSPYGVSGKVNAGTYTWTLDLPTKTFTNFNVHYERTPVTLTITKKAATITSGSDSREYNGQALTCSTLTTTGFIDFYDGYVDVTGTITGVGSADNAFATKSAYADYFKNYDVTTNFGTLTVTKAVVTEPVIASKIRNGETLIADVPASSLYTVTTNNGGSEPGSYDVVLTLADAANYKWSSTDSASVTLQFRILAIEAPVIVSSTGYSGVYDGSSHQISVVATHSKSEEHPLSYQWLELVDGNYVEIDGETGSTLTVSGEGCTASYKCVVSITLPEGTATAEAIVAVSITQATNSITTDLSIEGWTYGESAKDPSFGCTFGNTVFTYSNDPDGDYAPDVPATAGTWYVRAVVAGNPSYAGLTQTASFVIAKATVQWPSIGSVAYSGQIQVASIPSSALYGVTANNGGTDAGSYPVTLSLTDAYNYKWADSEDAVKAVADAFVISKADNTIASALAINGWTYGQDANAPAMSVAFGEPVFTYCATEDGEYISAVPANAGTWYVKATVAGNDNYTGIVTDAVSFEIAKADSYWSVDPVANNRTYDTIQRDLLSVAGTAVGGIAKYKVDSGTYGNNAGQKTYSGTYTVYYKIVGDSNHNDLAERTMTVTISPFNMESASVHKNPLTYNGNERALNYSVGPSSFRLGRDYEVRDNSDKATDAGEYTMYLDGIGSCTGTKVVTWTISKAQSSVTVASGQGRDYNGQVMIPAYTNKIGDGEVSYAYFDNNKNPIAGAPVDVGQYYVKVTVASTTNYLEYTSDFVGFTITKATNSIASELAITGWTYGQDANAPTMSVAFGEPIYTYCATENGEYTSTVPATAGTWYVKAAVAGTENYTGISADAVPFTISKAIVQRPAADSTVFTYNGQEQTYSVAVNDLYTVTGNKQTNAGTYRVTLALKDTDNCQWNTGSSSAFDLDFVIGKMPVVRPSADTTSFTYTGHSQIYAVADSELYTVSGNVKTAAGSYTVTVALKDKVNTKWSTDDPSADIEFQFVIGVYAVTAPVADTNVYTYTGELQAYSVGGSSMYTVSGHRQTNAGTYDVIVALKDKSSTIWSDGTTDDKTFQFVINKATVQRPAADSTVFTYTGQEQTYSVAADDLYTVTGNKQTNAGTYRVTIALKDTVNYQWNTGSSSAFDMDFTIGKAASSVTVAPVSTESVYSGSEIALVSAGTANGGTLVYSLIQNGEYSADIPLGLAADTYRVYYKVSGDQNHSDSDIAYVDVTISKAASSVTAAPVAVAELSYTGSAQVLVDAGISNDGILMYCLTENGEYSADIPVGTNAGSYTVYYKVSGDQNHNDSIVANVAVSIAKVDSSVETAPVQVSDLSYNGSAQALVTAGTANGGTMMYCLTVNGEYSAEIPTGTNAGSYTVYYKVAGDQNHNDSAVADVDVSIAKVKATVTAEPVPVSNLVYTGQTQVLVTAGTANGGTMVYKWGSNAYSADLPVAVEAGEFRVYFKVLGDDNHTDSAQSYVFAEISKIPVEWPSITSVSYTGSSQAAAIASSDMYTVTSNIGGTDAGAYGVTLTLVDSAHYKWSDVTTAAKTVDDAFIITKADNSVVADLTLAGWTIGDSSEHVPTMAATFGTPVFTYSNAAEGTFVSQQPTEVGAWYVKASVAGTGNYNALEVVKTFTILGTVALVENSPAAVADLIYSGQAQALVTAGTAVGGSLVYCLTQNGDYFAQVPVGTDAGTYTVYYKAIGNAGYDDSDVASVQVTISKADAAFTVAPAAVSNLVYSGQAQALITAGTTAHGSILYALDTMPFDRDVPEMDNAGTYTVYYRINGDANHSDLEGHLDVTIAKAVNCITELSINGWTFGAAANQPSATVTDGTPVYTYCAIENGEYSAVVPATAGTWYVKASVAESQNYLAAEAKTSFEIAKANVAWPSIASVAYNGSVQTAVIAAGNYNVTANLGGTDVGKYSVTLTLKDTVNYKWADSDDAAKTLVDAFEITKASNGISTQLSIDGWNYGQKANSPVFEALFGEPVFTYSSSVTGSFGAEVPATAGTWYVKATVAGTENYSAVESQAVSFVIAKIDASVATAPVAVEGLVYSGQTQVLVSAGSGNGGDMVYSLDGNSYSAEIPSAVNAGTYTVYYKVSGDANHNDAAVANIEVAIGKVAATVTAPVAAELTYSGQVQNLVTAGSVIGGTMKYRLGEAGDFIADVPSATDAGSYKVYYMVEGDANHNDVAAACIDVVVSKAANTITGLAIEGWTYGADAKQPSATVANGTIAYAYSSTENGEYSAVVPATAGTWYVKATVAESQNYLAAEAKISFEISKAAVEWPVIGSKTYVGTSLVASIPEDYKYSVTSNLGGTDAGKYAVTLTLTDSANYMWADVETAEKTMADAFEITKAAPAMVAAPVSTDSTETGEALVLITAGSANGGTVVYRLGDSGEFKSDLPTAVSAGSYTVFYKVLGDANHTDSEPVQIFAEILSAVPYHSITYVLDGGVNSILNLSRYPEDTRGVVFEPATKEGYRFAGWYSDDKFTAEVTGISAGSTDDYTVYAKFVICQYNATIDLDGGFIVRAGAGWNLAEGQYVKAFDFGTKASEIIADFGTPARNGYTFSGFGNADGTVGTDGISMSASWSIDTYAVTFDSVGGTAVEPVKYTILSETIVLPETTKDGSVFVGWQQAGSAGLLVKEIMNGSIGNRDYVAVWTEVISAADEGTSKVTAEAKEGDDYVAIVIDPALAAVIDTVDVKFNGGGSISFPMSVLSQAGTVTMKAVDKDTLSEEVRGKVGNGTVFTLSTSITNDFGDEKVTVTLPFALEVGKEYQIVKVYWLKDDGTLEEYEADYSNGFASFQTTHFSEWVVKGVDPETVTVTVDGAEQTVAFGAVFKDVVTAPARDGYTFAGWFTDSALTQAFDENSTVTAPVSVYSKYNSNTPATVDITVDGKVKTVAYGCAFKDAVPTPAKNGYTFVGWFTDSAHTKAFDVNTVITESGLVVYSYFTENEPEPEPSSGGSKGGMCGSTIAAIVVSMCAVLAIPVVRYVRP